MHLEKIYQNEGSENTGGTTYRMNDGIFAPARDRAGIQHVAEFFGVEIRDRGTSDEFAGVHFENEGVAVEEAVLVCRLHVRFKLGIEARRRVEHHPPGKNIPHAAEELRQATHNDVTIREELNVQVVRQGFVDDYWEVVLDRKRPEAFHVGGAKMGVPRKIGIKRENGWVFGCPSGEKRLQFIKCFVGEEVIPGGS